MTLLVESPPKGDRPEASIPREGVKPVATQFIELLLEPGMSPLGSQQSIGRQGMSVIIESDNRSLREIATVLAPNLPQYVYGIRILKNIQTSSNGSTAPSETVKTVASGIAYIGGKDMFPRRALRKKEKYKHELAQQIKKEGWKKVVRTRCDESAGWKGRWRCYEKGDMIIPLSKATMAIPLRAVNKAA